MQIIVFSLDYEKSNYGKYYLIFSLKIVLIKFTKGFRYRKFIFIFCSP